MRRPHILPLVISFTVVVLLLAACSGSSDESADTTLAPTTTVPLVDIATQLVDDWLAGWAAEAPDMGAAVFTDDGEYTNPTIKDCLFEDNYAEAGGGAFAVIDLAQADIIRCTFQFNTADLGGGAHRPQPDHRR